MRSENPEVSEEASPGRGIAGPVTFSLLLHAGMLALFVRAEFAAQAEARIAEPPPAIRVSLAMRPLPRTPEDTPSETQTAPEPLPVNEQPVNEEPVAEASNVAAETLAVVPDQNALEATSATEPVPTLTPERVRAAVAAFVTNRSSTETETWVSTCILEQKEHGTRDCTQQQADSDYSSAREGRSIAEGAFAGINRPQQQARITEALLKENTLMLALMEDAGALGQWAGERYYLNREQFLYLNGNGADPLWQQVQASQRNYINISKLPLPGTFLFRCKRSPCIYEYTGFDVERPENAEEEAGAFRVVPIVFGNQR